MKLHDPGRAIYKPAFIFKAPYQGCACLQQRHGPACLHFLVLPSPRAQSNTSRPLAGTADAAACVRDVLRTVAQCHARNVLIRDVKPDNFLYLTKDDDAPLKAIDFGIAQYCKADESLRDKAGTCGSGCCTICNTCNTSQKTISR